LGIRAPRSILGCGEGEVLGGRSSHIDLLLLSVYREAQPGWEVGIATLTPNQPPIKDGSLEMGFRIENVSLEVGPNHRNVVGFLLII